MKTLLLLLLVTTQTYAAEFTYDNSWYVIYNEGESVHNYQLKSDHLEKVPGSDCVLSPVAHKYRGEKDDVFSRQLACFKEDINETFKCEFTINFKDEDGEPDPSLTICKKNYGKYIIVMKIRRYPSGKYKNKQELKRSIEKPQTL
jgi:hypothetical protein